MHPRRTNCTLTKAASIPARRQRAQGFLDLFFAGAPTIGNKIEFKFKALKRHLLKRHLTLSDSSTSTTKVITSSSVTTATTGLQDAHAHTHTHTHHTQQLQEGDAQQQRDNDHMHRRHRMGRIFGQQVSHNRVGDNELSHQSRTTANPTSSATRWREKAPRHRRQKYSHKNWSTSPGMTSTYGHRRVGDRELHNNKQNYWENPLHLHREVQQQEYSQSKC